MENWTWGYSLIAVTIVIHATGVALAAFALESIRVRVESLSFSFWHLSAILICLNGGAGLLLAVLHTIEAAVWAAAYWRLGALDSPGDAILYSVDSITTRGASGLTLEQHWRMMGALEVADGMLLFGVSSAFLFTVMQVYWPIFLNRRRPQ